MCVDVIGVCDYFIEQFVVGCIAEVAKRRWLWSTSQRMTIDHRSGRTARRKTASIRCRSADVVKPHHAGVAYVSPLVHLYCLLDLQQIRINLFNSRNLCDVWRCVN